MYNKNKKLSFQQVSRSLNGAEDLLKLHKYSTKKYPFILQSVTISANNRYSILFAFPQKVHVLNNLSKADDFINSFTNEFSNNKTAQDFKSDIPFRGGWFCYWSYDYAQVIEPVLNLAKSDLPLAIIARIPSAIVLDYLESKIHFIAENTYSDLLPQLISDWDKSQSEEFDAEKIQIISHTEEPVDNFLFGVEAIKQYILKGDVFQVNLSRKWQILLEDSNTPIQVYRALRKFNPAPFSALADFGNWAIISSSPERLVRGIFIDKDYWLDIRPIAGTRKRTGLSEQDKKIMLELIANSKERAEHIMLLDLGRNDLGRICKTGTIKVNEFMTIESYEHVHHIVSNIRGKLSSNILPLDIIHSIFPGGTITGCPKIRCMEIIAELEQSPRESYTGSLGYLNRDGSLDSNILIRSFIQRKPKQGFSNRLDFRSGAGIVADSIAEKELQETEHKALGLLRSLGI